MPTANGVADRLIILRLLMVARITGMPGAMLAAIRGRIAHVRAHIHAHTAVQLERGQRLGKQQEHQHDDAECHVPTVTSQAQADKGRIPQIAGIAARQGRINACLARVSESLPEQIQILIRHETGSYNQNYSGESQ